MLVVNPVWIPRPLEFVVPNGVFFGVGLENGSHFECQLGSQRPVG